MPVVLTRSTTDSTRNCSGSMPPSWLIVRVAVEAGGDLLVRASAFGSRSPASCSIVNWSNGRSRLKASMTQSRYCQIERGGVDGVAVASRRSGPGRASAGPSARRSAARRAAGRPAARRRRATCRRGRRRPPPASAAGRSGRATAGGSSVTRSASGDGAMPSFSSRARMKWSMALRTQAALLGRGQCRPLHRLERPVRRLVTAPATASSVVGPFRSLVDPALQQSQSVPPAIAPFGGILVTSGFVPVIAWIKQTLGRLLGTIAGPELPPRLMPGVQVEPQVGLLLGRAVAGRAVGGEDRLDVARVIDRLGAAHGADQDEGHDPTVTSTHNAAAGGAGRRDDSRIHNPVSRSQGVSPSVEVGGRAEVGTRNPGRGFDASAIATPAATARRAKYLFPVLQSVALCCISVGDPLGTQRLLSNPVLRCATKRKRIRRNSPIRPPGEHLPRKIQ